jgi:ABC-type Zn uptake system ZnuABC Zn-binding protein ZnuA
MTSSFSPAVQVRVKRFVAAVAVLAFAVTLSACGSSQPSSTTNSDGKALIVTTSSLVADFVNRIAGDSAEVATLVPNGFDAHTYEPKPSELALLEDADLIVLADENLNAAITGLVNLSGVADRIVDLNAAALDPADRIYREAGNKASANPHTWTSPVLAAKWVGPLTEQIVALVPDAEQTIRDNAAALTADLEALDADIRAAFTPLAGNAKMVVYHDAWEYFGREYGIRVVGALQAVNFAEPSAAELAKMAEQIREENVNAFFGSEVFPSDVLEALETESGARYVPDLADDRLPGEPGSEGHSYIAMMRANVELLLEGLSS